MVVCKFWQQGACKFGENCRFEHPGGRNIPNGGGNRFAALQSPDTSSSRNNRGYQNAASSAGAIPYGLDKSAIIADLSSERPQWVLSAYGPGRHAPAQLFGGPLREQSFEEMRLLHYMGLVSGNPQQAVQEAAKLVQASEQQMQTALNNVDGAIDFIISAEREHPNRIDICKQNQATSAGGSSQNPFSAATQPASTANPFVAPSPFSANSFGAPSQQTTVNAFGAPPASNGTFGQPSSLGQKPNAFGAPSQVFGAPSQLGGGGAFGQPSTLGQKPNPFGAPSSGSLQAPSNTGTAPFSSFAGAANPFTQQTQTATSNHFDTPSQLITPGAFGTPSQPAQSNVFGQPSGQNPTPFGASNLPSQSPFGGVSVASFGAPSPAPKNPFAAPTTQTPAHNPFAAVSAPQQAPFGVVTSAPPANPFANPRQDAPLTANPLGTPTPTDPSSVMANTFASNSQPQQSLANGDAWSGSTGQHPSFLSYSSKDGSGRLTMFKGKRVTYRGDEAGVQNRDGSWEKIWFPEGAPALNKDTEMEDSLYDDSTKAAYMNLRQTGRFQGGAMPLLPPKRDWCSWDF